MSRSFCVTLTAISLVVSAAVAGEPYPGTKPLEVEGDIASQMIDSIDRFLLRKIDESVAQRAKHWKPDYSTAKSYNASIEPNRKRLAHILGVREARLPFDAPELVATTRQPPLVGFILAGVGISETGADVGFRGGVSGMGVLNVLVTFSAG